MIRFSTLLICALLTACGVGRGPSLNSEVDNPSQFAFLPPQAEKGGVFAFYQPGLGAKWRGNWTSQFDLSGVSWNDPRTATLIAPSFVVMAKHFQRPWDTPVMFHDRNGGLHTRTIVNQRNLSSGDITVAKLNAPLPPSVQAYPLADATDAVRGRPVIITDQAQTLAVHRIAAVSGNVIGLDWVPGLHPIYRRKLVFGDSGNPSFIIKRGQLYLIETHTTGGPGTGPFYGSPVVQAEIRTAMQEM